MTSQPKNNAGGTPVRRWRWLRFWGGLFGVAFLIGGFALWLVTRSWFIVDRVTPVLEHRIGGRVTIAGASYDGEGQVTLRGVRVLSPSLKGEAGEIAQMGRVTARIRLSSLLSGGIEIEEFNLEHVHVRLSESLHEAGEFNFMTLNPVAVEGVVPPRIRLSQAVFEVGVHDEDNFISRGTRAVTGFLDPVTDEEGWFDVQLIEVDGRGEVLEEGGFVVQGRWNARTNEQRFRLDDLDLNERMYAMCPQIVRLWWDRMKLSGRVSAADLRWTESGAFSVDFDVQDVGLILPLGTEDLWSRFQSGQMLPSAGRPRMRVRKGRIRLASDEVVLEKLEGELVAAGSDAAVPYFVNVRIDDLPELDWDRREMWMDEVLDKAPFEMRFNADEFTVQPDADTPAPAVELPTVVARVLERFKLTDWELSTSVEIVREPPVTGPDGELIAGAIRSRGQAFITDASGAFQRFPYPLHDVKAYLEFDSEKIIVHYVTGGGADGSTMRLTGTITPPRRHASFDMRLIARNVPVDAHLRDALKETQQRAFDSLLHIPSAESLAAAGLLPTEETVAELRLRRREAAVQRQRLAQLPQRTVDEDRTLARLDEELVRLAARIEAGAFELGGTVDLDLNLTRPDGPGHRTQITGRVQVHRVAAVYERFPYPLIITGGTLDWQADRVRIVPDPGQPGAPIITAGGGRGWLSGHLDLVRRDARMRVLPDIVLAVEHDRVNDLAYAAIPPAASKVAEAREAGWPGGVLSEGGQWMANLRLDGDLRYTAAITTTEDERLDYRATIELADGTAETASTIGNVLAAGGLLRSTDWSLSDCEARLHARPGMIVLESFDALHRFGHIDIEGRVDTTAIPNELGFDVRLREMELGQYLIALLPDEREDLVQQLWSELRPEGRFDAHVRYQRRGDQIDPVVLHVFPHEVRVRLAEEPVTLERTQGRLRITRERVSVDDLSMRVSGGDRDDGVISFSGAYGIAPAEEGALRVDGSWLEGHFQSPLVSAVLERFGDPEQAKQYLQFDPGGTFDASFNYASAAGATASDYAVRVEPHTLGFGADDAFFYATLDPGSTITFLPGRIELRDIAGRVGEAGHLRMTGDVLTGAPMRATLDLDYEGRLRTGQARVFLPDVVQDVLEGIELEEGEPSRIRNGRLEVTRGEGADAVRFDGTLDFHDASFRAGLLFSEVQGPFDVHVKYETGQPTDFSMDAHPEHMRLIGQRLTDTTAHIALSPDGSQVLIEDLRSSVKGGVITAAAAVGLGEQLDYTVGVQLISVPLGDFLIRDPNAPPSDEEEVDESGRPTGKMFARLDLSGERGNPAARYGAGVARVLDGRIGRVPVALQAFSLLQLNIPGASLDYGATEFVITGDRVILERIVFESTLDDAVLQKLTGRGELNFNTFELDARFQSRAAVLGIRDLVGGIGDRLATIEITGPVWDPDARLLPLAPMIDEEVRRTAAAPLTRPDTP